jgi:hypothetical protein
MHLRRKAELQAREVSRLKSCFKKKKNFHVGASVSRLPLKNRMLSCFAESGCSTRHFRNPRRTLRSFKPVCIQTN